MATPFPFYRHNPYLVSYYSILVPILIILLFKWLSPFVKFCFYILIKRTAFITATTYNCCHFPPICRGFSHLLILICSIIQHCACKCSFSNSLLQHSMPSPVSSHLSLIFISILKGSFFLFNLAWLCILPGLWAELLFMVGFLCARPGVLQPHRV